MTSSSVIVNSRSWLYGKWTPSFDRLKIHDSSNFKGLRCIKRLTIQVLMQEALPCDKWAVYDEHGQYYLELKVMGKTLFLPISLVKSDKVVTSLSYRWETNHDEISGTYVPYTMVGYLRGFWSNKRVWVDYINHLGNELLTGRVVDNVAKFYNDKEVIAMYLDYRCTEPEKLPEFALRGWMWQELAFSRLNTEYVTAEGLLFYAVRTRGPEFVKFTDDIIPTEVTELSAPYCMTCNKVHAFVSLIDGGGWVTDIIHDLVMNLSTHTMDVTVLVNSALNNLLTADFTKDEDALKASFAVISQIHCSIKDLDAAASKLIFAHHIQHSMFSFRKKNIVYNGPRLPKTIQSLFWYATPADNQPLQPCFTTLWSDESGFFVEERFDSGDDCIGLPDIVFRDCVSDIVWKKLWSEQPVHAQEIYGSSQWPWHTFGIPQIFARLAFSEGNVMVLRTSGSILVRDRYSELEWSKLWSDSNWEVVEFGNESNYTIKRRLRDASEKEILESFKVNTASLQKYLQKN